MPTDALFWHRLQFAFTITFHYLFPVLTMGLALLIVVMKALALRTRDPLWDDADVQLPNELTLALKAWSDEGTEHYGNLYSERRTPLPPGWKAEWVERGRALAREVAQFVGPVDYVNEATNAVERIEPA